VINIETAYTGKYDSVNLLIVKGNMNLAASGLKFGAVAETRDDTQWRARFIPKVRDFHAHAHSSAHLTKVDYLYVG
jgi:hypothetical protein